jgi:hypothetical protein
MATTSPVPDCPPPDAQPCSGDIYRLVSSVPPTESDFESHFDKYADRDWKGQECIARGLSVCLSFDAAAKLRKRFKAYAAHKVALASIMPAMGVIKQTGQNADHHTWWPSGATNLAPLFTALEN